MPDAPAPAAVSPIFARSLAVVPGDVDEQGHVSNLVTLRYVVEAATGHSVAIGWDHAAYVRLGAVFVVRRHTIDYLSPAYAGDVLQVSTWVASWSAATSERRTRIARAADGREVATALTLWALVSTETGRPRRIPAEVRDAFAALPVD